MFGAACTPATSYADLARAVSLSPSAVAERVRRREEAGVIAGYRATVDPSRVGLPIMALVRPRYPTGNHRRFHGLLDSTPEIVEASVVYSSPLTGRAILSSD